MPVGDALQCRDSTESKKTDEICMDNNGRATFALGYSKNSSPDSATAASSEASVKDTFVSLIETSLQPGTPPPDLVEINQLKEALLTIPRGEMEEVLEFAENQMATLLQNKAGQIPDFEKIAWMNELVLEVMFSNPNTEHDALQDEIIQAAKESLGNGGREPSAEQLTSFADELAAMDFDALNSFSMALMIGLEEALCEDAELPWLMERQEAEWEAEQRAEVTRG